MVRISELTNPVSTGAGGALQNRRLDVGFSGVPEIFTV